MTYSQLKADEFFEISTKESVKINLGICDLEIVGMTERHLQMKVGPDKWELLLTIRDFKPLIKALDKFKSLEELKMYLEIQSR